MTKNNLKTSIIWLTQTSVEGVGCEDEDKVLGHLYTEDQVLIKLSRPQPVDVDEHRETSQLEVHFE